MPTCSHPFALLCVLACLGGCTPRGGGGGGGGGGGDLPVATDQLVLTVDLIAMLDAYTCSPDAGQTTIQCADYDIPFSLAHDGDDPLVSLDRIEVSGGDMAFEDTTDCADRPWLPEPGATETESLSIRYDGEGGIPTLFHRCGGSMAQRTNAAPGGAPLEGEITVTVEIAGTDFLHVASASGSIAAP